MVELKNLKNVKFKLDERGKLRAQIGLNIGIIPMVIAFFVTAAILSQSAIWIKIAAGLGLGCILIMQIGVVIGAIKRYKAYNNAMKEYEQMNAIVTNAHTQEGVPAPYHG